MSIHQQDTNKRNDSEFIQGNFSHLVKGNLCRLLDGRRTTGQIENIDCESGMFRWRIMQFEDEGKYWDMPFGAVDHFQFELDCEQNTEDTKELYQKIESSFSTPLIIERDIKKYEETQAEIEALRPIVEEFLLEDAIFFKENHTLDFQNFLGNEVLFNDFETFMKSHGLLDFERKTQMLMVLNPDSGEWMKGLKIMSAEMGLTNYHGKIPRTKDIFSGLNSKENRKKFILYRMAFLRAYYSKLGITEVPLYRGMATESDYIKVPRNFVSFTFNPSVAQSFSGFEPICPYRNGYVLKMTTHINKLFMTYNETRSMNVQYKEAEAVVFYNGEIEI